MRHTSFHSRYILVAVLTSAGVLASCTMDSTIKKPRCGDGGSVELCKVSVVALIANPAAYVDARVRVSGYMRVKKEDTALWLNQESEEHYLAENAVRLDFSDEEMEKARWADRKFVTVTGSFVVENDEEGRPISYIVDIEKIEPRPQFDDD